MIDYYSSFINFVQILSDCDFFKPNLNEIKEYLGSEETQTTNELINEASSSLIKAKNLVITLGSEGMYYKNAEFEAQKRKLLD